MKTHSVDIFVTPFRDRCKRVLQKMGIYVILEPSSVLMRKNSVMNFNGKQVFECRRMAPTAAHSTGLKVVYRSCTMLVKFDTKLRLSAKSGY